jgi:tRNA(fMet)-specific endonuclease VapC
MKRVLLDTSAYTALLTGDQAVFAKLAAAEIVLMSIIVLGELYAGFRAGSKEQQNRNRLASFLAKPSIKILPATQDTAEFFGVVKDGLRRAGTPIPVNDVWIAAQAFESGAQLVTYDPHFSKVKGLLLWEGACVEVRHGAH